MVDQSFTESQSLTKKPKTNYRQFGRSGTFVTAYTVQDDYLNETVGIDGQILYHKILLSDSTVRKLYHSVTNPIKSALWDIQPASDDPKHLEHAALMKQILFKDIPGGFRNKLDEILLFPWHGHSVFEILHKNYISKEFGPYTGLLNLAFRDQRTLDEWVFSNEGILEKIHQTQSGDIEVSEYMEADTLLIFYNEKKGNDTGFPFCRMLYGNYKRKLLEKELQIIGIEKGAIGVPIVSLPEGVDYDSDEFNAAVEQLEAYTQAQNSYIMLPSGYEINLDQSNTFDPSKVQAAIKAENEEIAGSLVAMWLEMGIGGNSAVGSSTGISADFFRDGIEYLANKIVDPINLELIPSLMALNFGEVDILPTLTHSGIADEAGEELMNVITGYVEKGVIIPDEQLEDHVRQAHNLPKKAEGEMLENQESQDGEGDDDNNDDPGNDILDTSKDDLELSSKKKPKTPKTLIEQQGPKISDDIRKTLSFSSAKYINDVMARYKQLPKNKKQDATSKTIISGLNNLKKDLKRSLTETVSLSIAMARGEVPIKKDIELSSHERDMIRMVEKYGDASEIKLNDFSKLPAYIQVLIQKQADLISTDSLTELKKRADFSFSGIELKSSSEDVIKQKLEDETDKFIDSGQVKLKGNNAAAVMVNEGRDAFFFEPEVLEELHSFTFVNFSPKSDICKELAGTTFKTNDAESLRYTPPLHHNCKSYLRANLKTSKGTEKLDVSTLSPSAKAKKGITL